MQTPKWQIALGVLVLVVAVSFVGYALYFSIRKLASLDQPLIVAILAASATVLTSTLTIVIGRILERKKEIEAHFRQTKFDQYDELLKILYQLLDPERQGGGELPDDVIRRLRDWQRKLILFAGPKTVIGYVDWMRDMKSGKPTVKSFVLMDQFFKSLRSDLGISNRGLEDAVFAHLIVRNGDLLMAAAKTKPSMSFEELAQLEELLALQVQENSPKNESGSILGK